MYKNQPKWIKGLNVRPETWKHREDAAGHQNEQRFSLETKVEVD